MTDFGKHTPYFDDMKKAIFDKYEWKCQVVTYVKGRPITCDKYVRDLGHALQSGKGKYKKSINQPINYRPECYKCNIGRKGDNQNNRRYWMSVQVAEFGYNAVYNYIDGLHDNLHVAKGELFMMLKEFENGC